MDRKQREEFDGELEALDDPGYSNEAEAREARLEIARQFGAVRHADGRSVPHTDS